MCIHSLSVSLTLSCKSPDGVTAFSIPSRGSISKYFLKLKVKEKMTGHHVDSQLSRRNELTIALLPLETFTS